MTIDNDEKNSIQAHEKNSDFNKSSNLIDHVKAKDASLKLLNEHCPSIMEAIAGKDPLLKETAEATLSLDVFFVPGADINYALRALSEMPTPPITKLESSEARFLELRRLVIRARGDADVVSLTDEILRKYATSIVSALENKEEHPKVKKAAGQALSQALLGHKLADFDFIKKQIQDDLNNLDNGIKDKIKEAELSFIDARNLIDSLISEFRDKEEKGLAAIVQQIQLGIAKYNILFVILLIIALAFSAEYLTQTALPLVAAAIGAASAHLLAERNTVLGGQAQKNNEENRERD